MKTPIYVNIGSYLAQFFVEWEMFHTNIVGEIKTQILCPVAFFFENRVFYEKMWKNNVEPDTPQWQYGACTLHAEYLRLQIHTQHM